MRSIVPASFMKNRKDGGMPCEGNRIGTGSTVVIEGIGDCLFLVDTSGSGNDHMERVAENWR